MGEGFVRQLKSKHFPMYSAGIETHGLNPTAVKVMAEVGVDITSHKSTHVDDLQHIAFDGVVASAIPRQVSVRCLRQVSVRCFPGRRG